MASEILDKNLEIIDNAIQTAQDNVANADEAAQRAMQAADTYSWFNQSYNEFRTAIQESEYFGSLDLINEEQYADWNNYAISYPDTSAQLSYINTQYTAWSNTLTRPDSSDKIDLIDINETPWSGSTALEPGIAEAADDSIKYFYQNYADWLPTAEEPPIYFPSTAAETDPFWRYESEKQNLTTYLVNLLQEFFSTYYPLANDAMDEALSWLENTIVNGGTGITAEVENLIWQRHRDNIARETLQAQNAAFAEFSSRGFSLPPGALVAKLENISVEGLRKSAEASRDLAIERMKIEIDNVKFAVELATKTRMAALEAASGYLKTMMLGPETATKLADFSTNAQAKLISATADFYKARLVRDDMLMKAWATLMEQKSKDGNINAETQARMISAAADLYKARQGQDEMSLKAWATQMTTLIDAGKANIDAQTKVIAADADMYRAEVSNSELSMKAWATNLEQRGKDQANNLDAQVKAKNVDATVFNAKINEKEMSLKAWMAEIDQDIKIKLANLDAQTKAIAADSDVLRARVAYEDVKMRAWAALLEQKGRDGATNLQAWAQSVESKVRAAIGAADSYGKAASAALNSLTSIVGVSTQAFED
jgi:hypothetical protein